MDNISQIDVGGLSDWMIYTLAILLVIAPILTDIVRNVRDKSNKKKYDGVLNTILEKYDAVISTIALNQDGLYKNFNILLDVLYEKYANNLTLEVAQNIIDLVYNRTKYSIINRVQEYIHDESKYVNGRLDANLIREDISFLISNKYHQDIMLLNKLTFKGFKLSEHLIERVDYKNHTDKIINLIINRVVESNYILSCNQIKKDLESYYTMLINQGKAHLEEKNILWEK